jgi:acyl-CoA synthetase (AMP-forming)/AMP-acid ligase II
MVRGFQDRFGIMVINLFGSNEGLSLVSGPADVPDPDERANYFPRAPLFRTPYGAKPRRHLKTRLVDPETGAIITKEGAPGELLINGPAVFDGYYKAPEQTAAAFTADGYFRTGDLFQIEGAGRFLRFVGRCKDLIIRGGFNIAPEEIDQLLASHPKIADACAFGVPDEILGERVAVGVATKGDAAIQLEDVTAFLKQKGLAQFKLPERLYLLQDLPRNALNKVMRNEVRERALASDHS